MFKRSFVLPQDDFFSENTTQAKKSPSKLEFSGLGRHIESSYIDLFSPSTQQGMSDKGKKTDSLYVEISNSDGYYLEPPSTIEDRLGKENLSISKFHDCGAQNSAPYKKSPFIEP